MNSPAATAARLAERQITEGEHIERTDTGRAGTYLYAHRLGVVMETRLSNGRIVRESVPEQFVAIAR